MPRLLVQAPDHDRNFSLGWLATAWMEELVLHGDGDVIGEPVVHGDELTELIVDAYALHAPGKTSPLKVGRRHYDSVFYSRPKGADKSGQGGRFGLFEALGPARFAGIAEGGEVYEDPYGLGFRYVYTKGEPMGRHVSTPFIRCMATEENQTGNVYDTIHFNLTEGPLSYAMNRKDDAGLSRIILPARGEITPSTASAAAKDGGKETWVNFDESHLYNTPELRRMFATVTRNLRKRKKIAETWYFESTTMFAEGEDSVAEKTLKFAELLMEGRTRAKPNVLLDWRYGECDDLADLDKLKAGIEDAFGDAMSYQDIDSLVDEFFDPRKDPEDSRRYFLNARTSHEHSYIRAEDWAAVGPKRDADGKITTARVVDPKEPITLGFDGSRKRARGITDATALIGCCVSDGHLFEIKVWEQPGLRRGPDGKQIPWAVPFIEVDREVAQTFKNYNVVGFYADPAKWESYIAAWEAKYGPKLKIKSSAKHPIEWWMVGATAKAVHDILVTFEDAVIERQLSHDGSGALTRHVLNARRRFSKTGYGINKETPESPNKIDACVAAVLAYQARLEALAKGVTQPARKRKAPTRVR
ncbi:hypothetical protein GCM10022234_00250 [Aeromicrobium panaciterrae]|uniref:hypothetical protein n=1 Tax=Aeromicrobium panaciterrae TaxID=363861 RepID=UPI0031DB033F